MRPLTVTLLLAWVALLALGGCAAFPPEDSGSTTNQAPPTPRRRGEERSESRRAPLPVLRKSAPELLNDVWLNTEQPLRLADLRGRVVLVDFWTFGCINCLNVLPYLRTWHRQLGEQGLTIIGVHSPEFEHERQLENVKAAVQKLDVPYAVTLDNDFQTWRTYSNRYWPTFYLVDKAGQVRYVHVGEGEYERTEQAIRDLLAEE